MADVGGPWDRHPRREVFYIGHLVDRNGNVEVLLGLEYFFAPHNSHLVVLGRAIFSAFYNVFGTTYWVLRAAEVLGILVAVGLFYVLVQRRTTVWIALAFSVSLLFLGYASATFLWPFDLHTVYAAAFGLGAFLVLEPEDRKARRRLRLLVIAVMNLEVRLCSWSRWRSACSCGRRAGASGSFSPPPRLGPSAIWAPVRSERTGTRQHRPCSPDGRRTGNRGRRLDLWRRPAAGDAASDHLT